MQVCSFAELWLCGLCLVKPSQAWFLSGGAEGEGRKEEGATLGPLAAGGSLVVSGLARLARSFIHGGEDDRAGTGQDSEGAGGFASIISIIIIGQ